MRIIKALLKPLSFLPALCLMYMIYSFSAQDGTVSSQLSYKVSYTIVETGGKLLGEDLQPWQIDSIATRFHGLVRKLAHMTEYFALAISVAFPLYVYGLRGIWLMLVAGLICVAFACGDEYHQSFVAGRAPSKRDVLIDSFGVFWGIIVVRIIGWTGRKTIFRPFTNDHMNRKKKKRKHAQQMEASQPYPGSMPYQNGAPFQNNPSHPNGQYVPGSSPYPNGQYAPGSSPYPNGPQFQGQQPSVYPPNSAPYPNVPYQPPYPGTPYQNSYDRRYVNPGYPRPPMLDDDHHVSDRLSEDMSFKKLMQELKEQKQEARREVRKTDSKKQTRPKHIEIDEIDLRD